MLGIGSSWTLVESRHTKTLFLRKAIQEMELAGSNVILERVEALVELPEHAGAYDGFTSRATLTLAPTLAYASRLVRTGGTAFLWKGSKREEEMSAASAWRELWDFDGLLGIGSGKTVVARFKRK